MSKMVNMKRKALEDLVEWKNRKDRKPLLVYGARQVGKTWLLKEFGKRYFKNTVYVNFESNNIIGKMINEDINPKKLSAT